MLERLELPFETHQSAPRTVDVPICYGGELGPDLADIAAQRGLSVEQVIALHLQSPHRVYNKIPREGSQRDVITLEL